MDNKTDILIITLLVLTSTNTLYQRQSNSDPFLPLEIKCLPLVKK